MASSANDSLPDAVSKNGEGIVEAEGRSRRDVLRGLAAAAAAAIAGGVLSTEKAEAAHGTLNAVSNSGSPGIHGENTSFGPGVEGTSDSGTGVIGSGPTGVLGFSNSGAGILALGPTALHVQGNAKFSNAGSGTIPANQDSAFVSAPFVTALSHVTVTLTGDPGQAGSAPGFKPVVVWVERLPRTGGFTLHMARPVRVDTPFTFLVVEPT